MQKLRIMHESIKYSKSKGDFKFCVEWITKYFISFWNYLVSIYDKLYFFLRLSHSIISTKIEYNPLY